MANGQTLARLSIAVDKYAKAGEERRADFISCTAFGQTAQFLAKYFVKGKEILAEGHISTSNYTGQDGKKHYSQDVVLDRVEFCGSKGGETKQGNNEDIPF